LSETSAKLARIFRAESGQVLASLMVYVRDLELAEDALQDACEQAIKKWSISGAPDKPGAWLYVVAKFKLIDKLRQRSSRQAQKTLRLIHDSSYQDQDATEADYLVPDERLRLIFTCCHPALNDEARVALTLKTLCGLSIKEIARAFLSSEVAISQRITRAKRKIRNAGIAYEIPDGLTLEQRLPSVLSVIYLIYNESYSAYEGQSLTRQDLASEAIRLGHILLELLPRSEVLGLVALMLFHDARRPARSDSEQAYIPLEIQDRSLWKEDEILQARQFLQMAMQRGKADSFQIQAAISALHCEAKSWQTTDWEQINLLYTALHKLNPSPIVLLNQALIYGYRGDCEQAYRKVNALQSQLNDYQPFFAARAELETKLGLIAPAIDSYNRSISLSQNNIERDFLLAKRKSLELL
jgi:RNA polymerase sigma-70 factor (ECF subfamily)